MIIQRKNAWIAESTRHWINDLDSANWKLVLVTQRVPVLLELHCHSFSNGYNIYKIRENLCTFAVYLIDEKRASNCSLR